MIEQIPTAIYYVYIQTIWPATLISIWVYGNDTKTKPWLGIAKSSKPLCNRCGCRKSSVRRIRRRSACAAAGIGRCRDRPDHRLFPALVRPLRRGKSDPAELDDANHDGHAPA